MLLQADPEVGGTGDDATKGFGEGEDVGCNANAVALLVSPQINVVDFGSVHINEHATRKVLRLLALLEVPFDDSSASISIPQRANLP